MWDESPLGPIADLMWATPDDRRILVAASDDVARFVSAVYRFDEVLVAPGFTATVASRTLTAEIPERSLALRDRGGPAGAGPSR